MLTYLLTLAVVFAFAFLAGAVFVGIQHRRFREMKRNIAEYSETYEVIETNKRLLNERDFLQKKTEMQESEILRYRKSLAAQAKKDAKRDEEIRKLLEENRTQREEIKNLKRAEDARFGRLVRLLHEQGIQFTQAQLNELTP